MASTLDQLTALSAQMDKEEEICEDYQISAIVDFVANAPIGIVLTKENGIVVWCNDRFAIFLAAKKDDIIGKNVKDRYVSSPDAVFDKLMHREEIIGIPITLRRNDGKVVDCLLYSAVREIDGQWENTRCTLIGGDVHDL